MGLFEEGRDSRVEVRCRGGEGWDGCIVFFPFPFPLPCSRFGLRFGLLLRLHLFIVGGSLEVCAACLLAVVAVAVWKEGGGGPLRLRHHGYRFLLTCVRACVRKEVAVRELFSARWIVHSLLWQDLCLFKSQKRACSCFRGRRSVEGWRMAGKAEIGLE